MTLILKRAPIGPNLEDYDVLVDGRKVSGILLESQSNPDGTLAALIVGVGVNIGSHPPAEAVMYPPTSLHAEGARDEEPGSLLQRVVGTAALVRRARRRRRA